MKNMPMLASRSPVLRKTEMSGRMALAEVLDLGGNRGLMSRTAAIKVTRSTRAITRVAQAKPTFEITFWKSRGKMTPPKEAPDEAMPVARPRRWLK